MKIPRTVRVEVTDKNAVYINDTRITPRHTKWGIHREVDTFRCAPKNVRSYLEKRGHHVQLEPVYAAEFGI